MLNSAASSGSRSPESDCEVLPESPSDKSKSSLVKQEKVDDCVIDDSQRVNINYIPSALDLTPEVLSVCPSVHEQSVILHRRIPTPFVLPKLDSLTESALKLADEKFYKTHGKTVTKLQKTEKMRLLDALAAEIMKYTLYPQRYDLDSVAQAIVQTHPGIKDSAAGEGWQSWRIRLSWKMGNLRMQLRKSGYLKCKGKSGRKTNTFHQAMLQQGGNETAITQSINQGREKPQGQQAVSASEKRVAEPEDDDVISVEIVREPGEVRRLEIIPLVQESRTKTVFAEKIPSPGSSHDSSAGEGVQFHYFDSNSVKWNREMNKKHADKNQEILPDATWGNITTDDKLDEKTTTDPDQPCTSMEDPAHSWSPTLETVMSVSQTEAEDVKLSTLPRSFAIPKFHPLVKRAIERADEIYYKSGGTRVAILSRKLKIQLLEELATAIGKYTLYPRGLDCESVAKALVEQHPGLKDKAASPGWSGWKMSLQWKMGNLRAKLRKDH